ncbi:MAG: discoidin domain-containing protein [Paraglaciecola sp.]|nr:discoidin domain-containing protein [Paraglaciecola sp.]NCT48742.1 discoidin domain-containing protein [Paraglaciecola sp.]
MLRLVSAAVAFLIFQVSASVEIEGFPNKVRVSADGHVDVRLFLTENKSVICAAEEYHFSFPFEGMGETWVGMLQEARVMGQAITVEYDESDCQVVAVSLPLLFEDGGSTGSGPLEETGTQGNVALVGTNGLTASSFTANAYYLNDTPAGAFDGYAYQQKINDDAAYRVSRGIWLAKTRNPEGEAVQNWLQADFGKAVRLARLRITVNAKSVTLGRSPREVVLYVSNDGTNYTVAASTGLTRAESSDWAFPRTVTARYFKLLVSNNYGDTDYVEIDELEFFQQ